MDVMGNVTERDFLASEMCWIEEILADMPAEDVIDRMSMEARLKKVRAELAALPKAAAGETANAPVNGQDAPVNAPVNRHYEPVNRRDEPVNGLCETANASNETVSADCETVKVRGETVSGLDARVLELLRANPAISYDALASMTGKGRATLARTIAKLKAAGRLRRVGSDKTGHWEVLP